MLGSKNEDGTHTVMMDKDAFINRVRGYQDLSLIHICGMSVKEAVFWLLDFAGYRRIENPVKQPLVHQVSQKQAEERKPFVLPAL